MQPEPLVRRPVAAKAAAGTKTIATMIAMIAEKARTFMSQPPGWDRFNEQELDYSIKHKLCQLLSSVRFYGLILLNRRPGDRELRTNVAGFRHSRGIGHAPVVDPGRG